MAHGNRENGISEGRLFEIREVKRITVIGVLRVVEHPVAQTKVPPNLPRHLTGSQCPGWRFQRCRCERSEGGWHQVHPRQRALARRQAE